MLWRAAAHLYAGISMVAGLLAGLRKVILLRSEVAIAGAGIAHALLVLAQRLFPISLALGRVRGSINVVRQSCGSGAENEGRRESNLRVGEHCRVSCGLLLTPCWCARISC